MALQDAKQVRHVAAAVVDHLGARPRLAPTARWDDLWQSEHDRAFMVAGATKADLLADLGRAVDRSIAEGTSLETFRADFRGIVEKHGWHGWTGEGTAKGEAWRTRVIYRTNMATSYAAGRHAQLVAGGFAFWVYKHSGAAHPRLDHLSWDGLVLAADHPFWTAHFPPNGWGCGCKVFGARSRDGAKRVGGKPGKDLPDNWNRIDPRTGAPVGIGKGWAYAPGASVADTVQAMAAKPVNWDYTLAVAFMKSLPETSRDALSSAYRALPSVAIDLRRFVERVQGTRNGAPIIGPVLREPQRTLGLATTAQISRIEAVSGVNARGGVYDFVVDQDAVRHIMDRHANAAIEASRGQRALVAADFARLAQLVEMPDQVGLADRVAGHGPIIRFEKRFGSEMLVAFFDIRTRRRRLALVTMWVERSAGASPTMTP
ncbi:MAG: phage minor head protein [Pseudorhodobacter sp.]|nr:phage minor head protein [Pseudorhodobacter sp.]